MANPFEVLDSSLDDLENVLSNDDTADEIFSLIDQVAGLIPAVADLREDLLDLIQSLITGIEGVDVTLEGLLEQVLSEEDAGSVSNALTSVSQIADASTDIASQIGGATGGAVNDAVDELQGLLDTLETLPTEELKASILQTLGVLAARLQP